jgi:L-iditol 2-dehydrogenase
MAGKGARIEFFGGLPKSNPYATLDTNLIHYRELVLTGSFSQTMSDLRTALKLVSTGSLPTEKIITHSYPLTDMNKGIEAAMSGKAIKVSIQPNP